MLKCFFHLENHQLEKPPSSNFGHPPLREGAKRVKNALSIVPIVPQVSR